MTHEQTRKHLEIMLNARIVNWITADIRHHDVSERVNMLSDAADVAEQLAEDCRALANDLRKERDEIFTTERKETEP